MIHSLGVLPTPVHSVGTATLVVVASIVIVFGSASYGPVAVVSKAGEVTHGRALPVPWERLRRFVKVALGKKYAARSVIVQTTVEAVRHGEVDVRHRLKLQCSVHTFENEESNPCVPHDSKHHVTAHIPFPTNPYTLHLNI